MGNIKGLNFDLMDKETYSNLSARLFVLKNKLKKEVSALRKQEKEYWDRRKYEMARIHTKENWSNVWDVWTSLKFSEEQSSIKVLVEKIKHLEKILRKYKIKKGIIKEEEITPEKIREGVDIVNYIASYTKVRRTGATRYSCKCPLHNEKSPSMVIYTDTNSFFCFGCLKGGSVIDFEMFMNGTTLHEAFKKLSAYIQL